MAATYDTAAEVEQPIIPEIFPSLFDLTTSQLEETAGPLGIFVEKVGRNPKNAELIARIYMRWAGLSHATQKRILGKMIVLCKGNHSAMLRYAENNQVPEPEYPELRERKAETMQRILGHHRQEETRASPVSVQQASAMPRQQQLAQFRPHTQQIQGRHQQETFQASTQQTNMRWTQRTSATIRQQQLVEFHPPARQGNNYWQHEPAERRPPRATAFVQAKNPLPSTGRFAARNGPWNAEPETDLTSDLSALHLPNAAETRHRIPDHPVLREVERYFQTLAKIDPVKFGGGKPKVAKPADSSALQLISKELGDWERDMGVFRKKSEEDRLNTLKALIRRLRE
ncbi:hypothetical protein F4818DRAFT_180891 [Hypoxylon cercidicola]|nr:hypothetical protein F4818DRAFT_180891 [Hypoxylon cercidicola]